MQKERSDPNQQANPNKMPKALQVYSSQRIVTSSIPSESDHIEQAYMQ